MSQNKNKEYWQANRETILAKNRIRNEKNKEVVEQRAKEYNEQNKERLQEWHKQNYLIKKEQIAKKQKEWYENHAGHNPINFLKRCYQNQIGSSLKRNHPVPGYTRTEFVEEFKNNETFLQLHQQWLGSGKLKSLAPSFDRLDRLKGYSFNNIRLVTWDENANRWYKERE